MKLLSRSRDIHNFHHVHAAWLFIRPLGKMSCCLPFHSLGAQFSMVPEAARLVPSIVHRQAQDVHYLNEWGICQKVVELKLTILRGLS